MSFNFAICRQSVNLENDVRLILEQIGFFQKLPQSVFVKPNFTYPFFKPGVTTTRELIEALVRVLKESGCIRIVLGEGDGGYNAFSMDETFKNYRLNELTKRYGLEFVNVSKWPSLTLDIQAKRGRFSVNVPRPIFEDFDSFISLPVPKVHAMTTISNAVKNQWGIVQDVFRIQFHVAFDEIITEVCRRLPRPIALVDGTFGLTKNGPMIEGVQLSLGWISACDNLWLNDRLMCEIMQMPMEMVEHLMYAERLGLVPKREECRISGGIESFVDDRFYLKKNFWNYVAKSTWYSKRWNYFVYFSPLSNMLHKVMYSVRSKPNELAAKGVDWK